jgi:hypothetical protein
MNTEKKQVLDMLAAGKISSEEASRLLEKLETQRSISPSESPKSHRSKLKYLRILVDSADGDKVNIRVPLALVRTGIKLSTMMPSHASEKIREKGIDLTQLSSLEGDELTEALRELAVDVDSSDGDTVRIFCE